MKRLETVDQILAQAERPSIIIIQGDHGPGAFVNWNSVADTCLQEKMAILNAYYLPDDRVQLYDSITPVNSFRLIFNAYFGTDYELLPDESYFSLWDRPYDFIPIADQIGQSCSG